MASFGETVVNFFSGKKNKPADPPAVSMDDLALKQYRERISSYRNSFTAYNQRAPGFDYISWKPYGYWRQEDHSKTYLQQCHALGPWVRSTVDAAMEGLEEKRWAGLVGQPDEMRENQSRIASRAGSRENLIG